MVKRKKKKTRADLYGFDLRQMRAVNRSRVSAMRVALSVLHRRWQREPMADSYFAQVNEAIDQLETTLGERVEYYAEEVDD